MLTATLIALAGLALTAVIVRRARRPSADDPGEGDAPAPARAPVGLFEVGPAGVSRCNERGLALLGAPSLSRVRGLDLSRAMASRDARARWRRWLDDAGPGDTLQLQTRLRSGSTLGPDVILVAECLAAGAGLRVSGAITEAGELSPALTRLEREVTLLREIIDAAPVGMVSFDPDGRVGEVWNRAAEAVLGWPADAVKGEILPLVPAPRAAVRSGGEGGGPVSWEVRRWRRDGEAVDLSIMAASVAGRSGQTVAVLQDITERVQSEGERRRLSEIIRATPDLVLILDVDGEVLYRNPAARDRLGVAGAAGTSSELFGARWRERWHQEIVPMVAAGSSWTGELHLGPEPGLLVSVVVAGHRSHEGNLAYLSVLARDISQQRSVEEQLRQAQKLEAVGQLSGGIAHDFNNLLTVVQANAELLGEGGEGEAELLKDIRMAVRRGRDLVRRLMVFSREETLSVRPYSLAELEDYVVTLRRLLPETVAVEWECGAEAPVIEADPGALQQVLLNLATNARDAMADGGELRISVADAAPMADGSACVELAVSDTGTGIPAASLDRIFEPFYTTKMPGEGTGLGLSMVYALVGELGGEIRVDSELGLGTTFRLRFPRSSGVPGNAEAPSPPAEKAGRGETLLIVEDEPAIRRVAERTLERIGYTVLLAGDGEEGLEVFRAHADAIDLVISDVVMPRMGGAQLLTRIRDAGHDVPFMFMSGYTEREARREASVDASVFMLQKPWTREDLHAAVAQVLADRRCALEGAVP